MTFGVDAGSSSRGRLFGVAAVLLFGLFLAHAAYYVANGRVNLDEGLYLYAAGRLLEGELPYRDFAFIQAPLLPFVHAPTQWLWGPSIEVGRFTTLVLSACTVALGARLALLWGGGIGALFFLGMVSLAPQQVWVFASTRTESVSALLWMLSAFLLLGRAKSVGASAGGLLAAVLATATRASSLLGTLLVLAWVVRRHRDDPRGLALALLPGVAAVAAVLALVFAASLDVTWFHVFTAQAERHLRFGDRPTLGIGQHLLLGLRAVGRLHTSYGVVPLLGLGCGLFAVSAFRRGERPGWADASLSLLALSAVVYTPQLVPRDSYPAYFASVIPLVLVAVAWALGALVQSGYRSAAIAVAVGTALFQLSVYSEQTRFHLSVGSAPDLQELREVAEYVSSVVPAGGTLATTDTYLSVEADRPLPPGWGLSLFAYFPRLSDSDARRFHLLSPGMLARSLEPDRVDAVVLSDRGLGVLTGTGIRGFRPYRVLEEAQLHAALPALEAFRLDRTFERFGQFGDALYVLLPRER